ncbi:MAG TPA: alanine racemase, partial [Bacteroidales bacterium]|nr:alanine racemase [Bacteroidales bacterium]
NAIHVFVFLHSSGYTPEFIASVMNRLEPVAMRMEIVGGMNNCTLINDTYNSDLVSLSNALDVLNQQNQHRKKTIILSDILQSGKPAGELYRDVSALVEGQHIDRFIGIGPEISAHSELFMNGALFYTETEDFLTTAVQPSFRNEAILLKGSRKFHFEMIARVLQEKAHRTVMEIDLNALVENYRYYKSVLPRDTKIMAMVKAFSYGSGGYEVANVLQYNHVDYLAVAFADEGVTLRKNGIHVPVMVMNPEKNDYFLITEYNLEPEIYSFRILEDFSNYLERNGLQQYPVHLKIDTGMHRLGFEEKDTEKLITSLKDDKLKVVSVFSHLAAADEPANDEFTTMQIDAFRRVSDRIQQSTGQTFMRHILNSAGIERFPSSAFDMVRLGIGLYGVSSFRQDKLQEVSSFKTSVAQIREVQSGDTIGYSRRGKAEGNRRIATLPVGYADGVFRALGNGRGTFMVNGHAASVIGNVCMDMTMIDITGIPVEENDEVIIFGKENPVQAVAASAGTIPYEILTRISERVKRIYFRE